MDSLGGYIATIVVSLIAGYLSQFLQPRSKLVWWSPHNFVFDLKKEAITLVSNSMSLQNLGRQAAEDIEIIHSLRPDFLQFSPAIAFEQSRTRDGQHVIRVKSLGPKEWVYLQLLSYKTAVPQLQSVRWKGGQGQWIPTQLQRLYPRWHSVGVRILLLIGGGTLAYWIIRAGSFVLRQAGLFG